MKESRPEQTRVHMETYPYDGANDVPLIINLSAFNAKLRGLRSHRADRDEQHRASGKSPCVALRQRRLSEEDDGLK
ncbi:uncharacterized [Tachysurus ichikawai]